MAYTTINKGSDYFNTVAYSGTGVNPTSITSVGFQPDFLWIKCRTDAFSHLLFDAVRGVDKRLVSNSTAAETTETQIASFDTNGWTMDSDTANNGSGKTYVAWNWLASNTTASNTDGSIASTVSVNTTSGFSIVSYTGTGAVGNIGHGLGATPKVVIKKRRNSADAWNVWLESIGDGSKALYLNTTNAIDTNVNYASNVPTSSLFYVGTDSQVNGSGITYIAYCFAEKKGFSKFGSYTGNGSTDGAFVYTGFKPAFVIIKQSSASGESWILTDNKRSPFNQVNNRLFANNSNAESTDNRPIDYLSNGFKMRTTDAQMNTSSATYIYMAFAENPFVTSTGIPACAR